MVYIAQQSFGFGEIDPNLRAQYESQQYQRGCRTLSNALLSDTGSALKRWGSVFDTASPGDYKAFEFINGYGDRFLVLGSTTGYSIERNGTVVATYTVGDSPTDAVSTGNDLFLLTKDGVYLHSFSRSAAGVYTVTRTLVNININILSSTPPVTFTADSYNPTTITASSDWFSEGETGDLYKISQRPVEDQQTNSPRFGIISYVQNKTVASVSLVDSVNLDQTKDMFPVASPDVGKLTITNHNFQEAQEVKWYRGIVSALYYTNEPAEAETCFVKVDDADTIRLYEESDLTTLHNISSAGDAIGDGLLGQHPSSYVLRSALPTLNNSTNTPTYDWVGPYRHWVNLPNGTFSTTDGSTTGVKHGEIWATQTAGTTVEMATLFSFGGNLDRCMTEGSIVKAEHWINGNLFHTTYFMVSWKCFARNNGTHQGPSNEKKAYLTHIAGPAIIASSVSDNEQMIFYLATSESQPDGSSAKFADGKPFAKNGWNPSILVREKDRSPGGTPENAIYPVGIVGSSNTVTFLTSGPGDVAAIPTIAADGEISGSTPFDLTVRLTETVGEEGPALTSQTFRVGTFEVDGFINYFSQQDGSTTITTPSLGPTAYWRLTGNVPEDSPNSSYPSLWQTRPTEAEYHQGRLFLTGFDVNTTIAAGKGGISQIPESQNLGLTIIASRTGVLTDFTGGAEADDGLSFQLFSKKGGSIRWLKSQFNILFVGSDDEEFLITDVPITPTSINISIQSEYGGRSGVNAVSFGSQIVYVQADGKTVRAMDFQERRNRFESRDLLQFAKHITKNDTIKRIEVVGTATQVLFALTTAGKLYCLTINEGNAVFGWNEWSNSEYTTISDIVGTSDASGNPALWVKTSPTNAILITSDDTRNNYHVDGSVDGTSITATGCTVSTTFNDKLVSVILTLSNGDVVYIGDITVSSGSLSFGHDFGVDVPTKVVIGYPYTMTLAPNIPELMVPGKGSTLGRGKNVSRLRVLFNQARGAKAAGYDVLPVPLDPTYVIIPESSGFYSIPVVGEYGPQPVINITQSAPYGFEVSGYNAEYDFGD